MSPRTETSWGAEVELSLPIKVIVAKVRAHVERRVAKGVHEIATGAGITDEELLARLESGTDAQAELVEQTLRAIGRKASEEHRQALARVAAQALAGDDAAVDRAVLVVETIDTLQPVHVRALLAAATLNQVAGIRAIALEGPSARQNPQTIDRIADEAAIDPHTLRGLLGQLIARGLLWLDTVPTLNFRTDDHVLTQLGADVLNGLLESEFEGIRDTA